MLTPDEITQDTGPLEQLPRILDRRSTLNGRRQTLLQQKQTDALPQLTTETPNAKLAWRQVVQLREENRRLRFELQEKQAELQQLVHEYQALQETFDKEVAVIHSAHQQVTEQYQGHLRELMEERNRLHDLHADLEQRYKDLYHSFQDAAEEEARKMLTEAAQTVILSPDNTPVLLQDVVKTVELQVRQQEDKHLIEAMYLKREIQRIAKQLEQERQQINQERQQLVALQLSIREQAELRQKTLASRLQTRWKLASIFTSIGLPILLVVLQFIFLALFHVSMIGPVSIAILAPIVVCVVLALALVNPIKMVKIIYTSAPHKKKY